MDPRSNKQAILLKLQASLSDLSCSSGPSRPSTGNTSPDSLHPETEKDLNADDNGCSLIDPNMYPSTPSQSVDHRREKQRSEHSGPGRLQSMAPPALTLSPTSAPRGPSSANWRSGNSIQGAGFGSAITPSSPSPALTTFVYNRRGDSYASQLASISNSPFAIMKPAISSYALTEGYGGGTANRRHQHDQHEMVDRKLSSSFAYCFERPDGRYTPLIPADMLPALRDIPALSDNPDGMIILPFPRALGPNGRLHDISPVQLELHTPSTTSGTPSPTDSIQCHIDSIIAASPPPSTPKREKREKIYCDKWVHEGLCAFTQQGCKYKHEMPFDRATQHSLGLFHGLPQWYKKQQAELARQRDVATTSNNDEDRNQPVARSPAAVAAVRSPAVAAVAAVRNSSPALSSVAGPSRERPLSAGLPGRRPTAVESPTWRRGEGGAREQAPDVSAPAVMHMLPRDLAALLNGDGRESPVNAGARTPLVPFSYRHSNMPCRFGPIGPPSTRGSASASSSAAAVSTSPFARRSARGKLDANNPFAMLETLMDDANSDTDGGAPASLLN